MARGTMMKRLFILLTMLALASPPALADPAPGFGGVWVFEGAPDYPGVTMLEVRGSGGAVAGRMTTRWYGPITLQNARVDGGRLTFDIRNLNDRDHATRQWTARLTASGIRLEGTMWHKHAEQDGRRATATEARQRRFRPAGALPRLRSLPADRLAQTPPMGWSSWNKFAEAIDDKTIRAIADAMVATGLRDAGYVYVNIDDGWQGERDRAGVLHPNAKFPDMKGLADYVHARGLKLGIYSSPGPKTCAGFEGSYGHVRQDARTFAGWGVDYLKYDLCSGEWFYADADTVKRTYLEMGLALRATGRPIVFSLCEYGRFDVADWGRSVGGHLWRTTGDIKDDYKTMADIGFVRNPRFPHAGPGGWNDPDMLEIGNGGMSDDEYVTHMTLWAMSAAPLLMGHDVRATSKHALALLTNREVIAIDQDALGLQGKAVRRDGDAEVWTKRLADGSVAVALFNRSTTPQPVALRPADAGLARFGKVRDLWQDRDLADVPEAVTVPGHGAALFRVSGG